MGQFDFVVNICPKMNLKKKERSEHMFFVPKLPQEETEEDLWIFGFLDIPKSLNVESDLLPSSWISIVYLFSQSWLCWTAWAVSKAQSQPQATHCLLDFTILTLLNSLSCLKSPIPTSSHSQRLMKEKPRKRLMKEKPRKGLMKESPRKRWRRWKRIIERGWWMVKEMKENPRKIRRRWRRILKRYEGDKGET